MQNFWELEKDAQIIISNKKFKVLRSESFRLPKAKQDSARWIFLKSNKKHYVIYIVNKKGRKLSSLEEINLDTTKKQWWRNYTAIRKL